MTSADEHFADVVARLSFMYEALYQRNEALEFEFANLAAGCEDQSAIKYCYLPFSINDAEVLILEEDGYLADNSQLKAATEGLWYCDSKDGLYKGDYGSPARSQGDADDNVPEEFHNAPRVANRWCATAAPVTKVPHPNGKATDANCKNEAGGTLLRWGDKVKGVVEETEGGIKWLNVEMQVPTSSGGNERPLTASASVSQILEQNDQDQGRHRKPVFGHEQFSYSQDFGQKKSMCQTMTGEVTHAVHHPAEEFGKISKRIKEKMHYRNSKPEKSAGEKLLSPHSVNAVDTIVGIVIIINTMVLYVQQQFRGYQIQVENGWTQDVDAWDNADDWFYILEICFCAIFVIELMWRICVYRLKFFCELMSLFDMCIVLLNVIDLTFRLSSISDKVSALRFLRLARLTRALRVLRTFSLFSSLRILIKAVSSSLVSLLWSMTLLFMFMTIGALLVADLVAQLIGDETVDDDLRIWAWTHYGTSLRATYTMFEITMSGCWPNNVKPFVEAGYWGYVWFFMIYVTLVVFAVIRIITAMFLKETLDAANNDAEIIICDRQRKKQGYLKKLKGVFQAADTSNDGLVTLEEFDAVLTDPAVCCFLQHLELEIHEGKALFQMLDNGDGVITYEEFINGVSRLKGQARTIDLIKLQLDSDKMMQSLDAICRSLKVTESQIRSITAIRSLGDISARRSAQDYPPPTVSPDGGLEGDFNVTDGNLGAVATC